MEIYIKLFEVIFPVFFVIGVGYYLGKNKELKDFGGEERNGLILIGKNTF